jgi:hypothetical protein
VYESRCKTCNPGEKVNLPNLEDHRPLPSIYVGESARSLKERAGEHQRDYDSMKDDSHMLKHWTAAHGPRDKPKFTQVVVRRVKTALDRQIAEAIRIQLRGNTLNSVGVYNRCRLTRLVVHRD